LTRRNIPAPRKGYGPQGPGQDNVARGAPKEDGCTRGIDGRTHNATTE
jgi:hypothetical protein